MSIWQEGIVQGEIVQGAIAQRGIAVWKDYFWSAIQMLVTKK